MEAKKLVTLKKKSRKTNTAFSNWEDMYGEWTQVEVDEDCDQHATEAVRDTVSEIRELIREWKDDENADDEEDDSNGCHDEVIVDFLFKSISDNGHGSRWNKDDEDRRM